MIREGVYRDKDGRPASVRRVGTGYLIRYRDGRTITIRARPHGAAPGRYGRVGG